MDQELSLFSGECTMDLVVNPLHAVKIGLRLFVHWRGTYFGHRSSHDFYRLHLDAHGQQDARAAKNISSMNSYFLALLFLSPLVAYAVRVLVEENRDPLVHLFRDSMDQNTKPNIGPSRMNLLSSLKRSYLVLGCGACFVLIATNSFLILVLAFVAAFSFFKWNKAKAARLLSNDSLKMSEELPSVVELFTILISGGQSIIQSLHIISERATGELSKQLTNALLQIEGGKSFTRALDEISRSTHETSVRRFFDSLVIATERGTPLAEVLTRQVREVRDLQRNKLLRSAGKAEVALMIPVVFLILPISVLFALWPSFVTLGQSVA